MTPEVKEQLRAEGRLLREIAQETRAAFEDLQAAAFDGCDEWTDPPEEAE